METTGEAGREPKRTELSKTRECQGQTSLRGAGSRSQDRRESQEVIGDLRQSIFSGGWSQIREV